MEASDIAKYKSLYLQTARAYLKDMQHNLKILLESQDNPEAVKVVHLASHSLASQSLLMGYTTIGSASFAIEKIFKAKMEDNLSFKEETIQLINAITDKMVLAVDEVDKTGKEIDLSKETKELEDALRL
jgi:chemotaxis protein histidine kinase CheA